VSTHYLGRVAAAQAACRGLDWLHASLTWYVSAQAHVRQTSSTLTPGTDKGKLLSGSRVGET